VGDTTPHTLPLPAVDTAGRDATPALRQCATENSCSTAGTFDAVQLLDGSSLPAWISWTSGDTALSIEPTSGDQNGDYTITVTYQPDEGDAVSYTATVVSVTCTVTSFAAPDAPTTGLTYSIFDASHTVPIAGDYV